MRLLRSTNHDPFRGYNGTDFLASKGVAAPLTDDRPHVVVIVVVIGYRWPSVLTPTGGGSLDGPQQSAIDGAFFEAFWMLNC